MVVVVELSVVPLGLGPSVSRLIAEGIKELERRGVKYQLTPMSTVYEASSVEEAFEAAKAVHEAIFKAGAVRLVTTVKVDDRRDVERKRMEEKVEAVRKILGES
ncbi:MAG: hypothetical protein AYL30_003860 [Candidatus Hecatellales archaeon B24]|nr:MAG: hypothetical protein AYL30_003860 [Candidatus Hecatellales archaeon B24]